jgi:hypothetical protein
LDGRVCSSLGSDKPSCGGFATALNNLVPDSAVADMREELKDAGAKAAAKKIAWLRNHTDRLPSVLTKRGRGAPIKTEFKRQAEREQFIEDITTAYCKLKDTTGGKRITKTDVVLSSSSSATVGNSTIIALAKTIL